MAAKTRNSYFRGLTPSGLQKIKLLSYLDTFDHLSSKMAARRIK